MQAQTKITINNYSFDSRYCIGQGSFGKVYKGKNIQTQQIVAIKQIDRLLVSEQEINKEIDILKSLMHPNIVRYEATLKTSDFFYIVTEYCNGGDLQNLFEDSAESSQQQQDNTKTNIKLQKLIDMFFQICQGFTYLQKNNIIHRDLKPTNILIHNGVCKIADFGVSRTEKLHKSLINNQLVGVPIYMSPQILSKNFYSYKCDIWSLGIIIYQFYFQSLPWKANDINSLFFQIMANPTPYLSNNKKLPNLIKCIFQNTLQYLEKQRMSWQELMNLKNKRKKIFQDSNSNTTSTIKNKYHTNEKTINNYPYTDLSASKINKDISDFEKEIIHHIICQCESLENQLTTLLGNQCFSAFLKTIKNYLLNGIQHKRKQHLSYIECFIDCGFFLLKIAGQNLHLYMIDLNYLEQARPLLILLQLVHDLITMKPNCIHQQFRKVITDSYRSSKIDQYAASVISKINTYTLNDVRNF